MIVGPNFFRPGVIDGFALALPGSGLVPTISIGALFANGVFWAPGAAPAVPAMPVSSFRYLAYNTGTGLYWTVNPAGTTAGDAVLGWAVTNGTDVVAVSNQDIAIAASSTTTTGTSGGGTSGGTGTPVSLAALIPGGLDVMTPAGGNLTPDLIKGWVHQVTLGAGANVLAPVNVTVGGTFIIQLIQDATGGRAVTFAAFYKGLSDFVLDTRANTCAALLFQIQTGGTAAMLLQIAMNGNSIL